MFFSDTYVGNHVTHASKTSEFSSWAIQSGAVNGHPFPRLTHRDITYSGAVRR